MRTYPSNLAQCDGGDLGEQGGDQPVANSGRESASATSDLHGHDFTHVYPADRAEGERENDGYQEKEKNSTDGVALPGPVWVCSVESSFREKRKCDGECSD